MNILLVDDHAIVRDGLRRLLATLDPTEIGEAATGREAIRQARSGKFDLVILDLNLPDRRGLDLFADLKAAAPGARVIVLSMYEEVAFVTSAMEAGARGYVTKNDDPECLFEAIDVVMGGDVFLSRTVEQRLARARIAEENDPLAGLNSRERKLLELLGQGKTIGEASGDLGVSYRTTAEEAARIRGRLGLRTNSALIKYAVERLSK